MNSERKNKGAIISDSEKWFGSTNFQQSKNSNKKTRKICKIDQSILSVAGFNFFSTYIRINTVVTKYALRASPTKSGEKTNHQLMFETVSHFMQRRMLKTESEVTKTHISYAVTYKYKIIISQWINSRKTM